MGKLPRATRIEIIDHLKALLGDEAEIVTFQVSESLLRGKTRAALKILKDLDRSIGGIGIYCRKPDEKLPSVRELASMIRINPNTIQKAYKYLEEDNYIYTVKGVGNFVKDADELKNLYIKNVKDELYKVLNSLKELGLRDERIIDIVKEALTGTKGGHNVNHK